MCRPRKKSVRLQDTAYHDQVGPTVEATRRSRMRLLRMKGFFTANSVTVYISIHPILYMNFGQKWGTIVMHRRKNTIIQASKYIYIFVSNKYKILCTHISCSDT